MIKELCCKLRDKRKELGYSIEYVVEKTKLYPSVILDIENCNLSKINTTYIKGFIKIYAAFLKIDIGTSLEEITSLESPLKKVRKSSSRKVNWSFENIKNIKKKLSPALKSNLLIFIAGIIIIGVVFLSVKFTVTKIFSFFKSKPKAKTETKIEPKTEDTFVLPENFEELAVTLTAKDKCFLKVIADGKLLFQGLLDKGVTETWKGTKELEFKISDGSAVYLEINGKAVPTLTTSRRPIKSLKVNASGITVEK